MTEIFEASHRFEANREAPKMLIADDDPAILSLLSDHFVNLGF